MKSFWRPKKERARTNKKFLSTIWVPKELINSSEGNSHEQLSVNKRASLLKSPIEWSRNTKLKEVLSSPEGRRLDISPLLPIKSRFRPNLNINIDKVQWY